MNQRSTTINIKRIYDRADRADGTRVLVDRLWPRGMTKERAAVDLWLKEIAPSATLRKWFHHDLEHWREFQSRYRTELDHNVEVVGQVLALAATGHVTLLFGAQDVVRDHAAVLADYLETAEGFGRG